MQFQMTEGQESTTSHRNKRRLWLGLYLLVLMVGGGAYLSLGTAWGKAYWPVAGGCVGPGAVVGWLFPWSSRKNSKDPQGGWVLLGALGVGFALQALLPVEWLIALCWLATAVAAYIVASAFRLLQRA